MARPTSKVPTQRELAFLQFLWANPGSTVREVFDGCRNGSAYNSTLKVMQIMEDKGLIGRDGTRPHKYAAAKTRQQIVNLMVGEMLRSVFLGDKRAFSKAIQALK